MARYTGPKNKLSRREGYNLFGSTSRSLERRLATPPGEQGSKRRRKESEYGIQLREKQKVKRMYGLIEGQFRNLFETAAQHEGVTGANLLIGLETRLDNVVFRLGFAPSRSAARQLVRHRHVEVNGRTVDIPSYRVRSGDEVSIRSKSKELAPVEASLAARTRPRLVEWLSLDEKNRVARVVREPTRDDISADIQEQLIVELYSK
jgi:small subunit ribosomal protein S4